MGQEFVISDGQKGLVKFQKERIQKMFDVNIALADPPTFAVDLSDSVSQPTGRNLATACDDKIWVEITGHSPKLCAEARAYIVSLSQREQTFPADVLDKIERNFAFIEEETGTLLSRPKRDKLVFVGSEEQIAKAISLVENFSNSNSVNMHDLGTLLNTSETKSNNCLFLKAEGDTAAVADIMADRDPAAVMPLRNMQSYDYSRTTLLGGTGCKTATTSDRDSSKRNLSNKENATPDTVKKDNCTDSSEIHKHMVKLGYRTEEVWAVLDKLGSNASTDKVLAILVSRANSSDPRIFMPDEGEVVAMTSEQEEEIDENDSSNLRPIMIDGSNVAMSYGGNQHFDCNGIKIVVDYFLKRGHEKVFAFVPQFRKEKNRTEPTIGQEILTNLEQRGHVKFTPSRRIGTKRIVSYDDRYILDAAIEMSGIVVSNDHFRDFLDEEGGKYKKVIEEQQLMYTFVEDLFMPTQDPLGKHGPHLDEFLRKKPLKQKPQSICPYGSRCTFGDRCKYHHPERRKGSRTVTQKLNDLAQENLRYEDRSDGGRSKTEPLPGYKPPNPSAVLQEHSSASKQSATSPLPNYPPPGVPSMRPNMQASPYQNATFPLSNGLSGTWHQPSPDTNDLHKQMEKMLLDNSSSNPGLPSSYPPGMEFKSNSPLNTGHLTGYVPSSYHAAPMGTPPHHSSPYSSPNSTGMLQRPQENTFTGISESALYSRNLEKTALVSRGPQVSTNFPSHHQNHPSHMNHSERNFTSASMCQPSHFNYPVSSHHIHNPSSYHSGLNTYPLTEHAGHRAPHVPQRSISLQEGDSLRIREQIYQHLIRYYAKELVRNVMCMYPQETNFKNLEMYIRKAMLQERYGL